jgi:hypothetical protein
MSFLLIFKLDKATSRLRNMKRSVDGLEEELSQMKQRLRRAVREKEEIEETSSATPIVSRGR